eukprot:scaffold1695_cov167-Amphora_coffeaeformis.AAC.16
MASKVRRSSDESPVCSTFNTNHGCQPISCVSDLDNMPRHAPLLELHSCYISVDPSPQSTKKKKRNNHDGGMV